MYDEKSLSSLADAGRFPTITPLRTQTPLAFVRDLTLRVRVRGKDVGDKSGFMELGCKTSACDQPCEPMD